MDIRAGLQAGIVELLSPSTAQFLRVENKIKLFN